MLFFIGVWDFFCSFVRYISKLASILEKIESRKRLIQRKNPKEANKIKIDVLSE